MDDRALVEALRAGDPRAPGLLIDRYQGVIFGLCLRMMGHRHDAEDVMQETFLRALRGVSGFDGGRPLRPWLLGIAANRCRTALSRRGRRPATVEAGTTAFTLTNESAAGEDHEMIIMRKADGVDLTWDEIMALGEEESMEKVEFKGAGFAATGAPPGTVLTELESGEYAALCFIPVGGAEGGEPHFLHGMLQEFTVE